MWLTYFIAFAYIVILLRLLTFAIGTGSFEDRLGKMKNWFFGLILFTLSWFLVSKIFGVGNGSLKIGDTNKESTTEVADEFKKKDKNNNSDDGVPITLQ
jgi:hypothetical protein